MVELQLVNVWGAPHGEVQPLKRPQINSIASAVELRGCCGFTQASELLKFHTPKHEVNPVPTVSWARRICLRKCE